MTVMPHFVIIALIWSDFDHVITRYAKRSSSFIKVWLTLILPQLSSHVTHLSCNHVIFAKRCISSFTTLMTVKLGGVTSYGEGAPPTLSRNLLNKWTRAFWETSFITNARPQHSAGDIKHRKTHKPKTFFIIQKILTYDSNQCTPFKRYLNYVGK